MNPSVELFARQQGLTGADYSQYVQLDLYKSEPIKLTKSVQGLEEPEKTTSGYSQTFRVPHTSSNGTYFKAVFNVNVGDYDASKVADAYINVEGRYFTSGNIRLTNIFRNGREGKIEYELVFMGETSNFGAIVGPKSLSDLNLNQYTHSLNYTTVTNSWNGNLFNGDVVYPLAEYGYTYNNSGVPNQPTVSVYNGTTSTKGFTNVANPMEPEQLRPAVRVKKVWDKIFEEAGFTYESNFLGAMGATASNFFDNIYMLSTNVALPTFQLDNSFRTVFTTNILQPVTGAVSGDMSIVQVQQDPSNSVYTSPSSYYEAPGTGQPYTFIVRDVFNEFVHNSAQNARDSVYCYVDLYKNGSKIATRAAYSFKSIPGQPQGQGYLSNDSNTNYLSVKTTPSLRTFTFTANGTVDDQFTAKIRVTSNEISSLHVTNGIFEGSGQPYVTPAGMLPTQYKQVDFIKGINDRFKLVWEPDPDNPKNFYIEPWNDWILEGQQRDWTQRLDEEMDVAITPLFYSQKREIFYQDAKEGDLYNVLYENQKKEIFGELKYDSKLETIKGIKNIKSFFAPTPLAPIPGDNTFLLPHFAKDTSTERQPIQVKPRLLFWNGLQTAPTSWYLNNGGTAVLQTTYPVMSQFSLYPFDENAFDLNWSNSDQYWDSDLVGFAGRTNKTAYRQYWETWANYTYSSYSRKMEATFVLNSQEIQELRFNDKIYVKDSWWLVQEIKDYVLGAYSKARVTLIKMADNAGFALDQAPSEQGTLTAITGLCFSGGFTNPSVCTACCCEGITNVTVYSQNETLATSFALYADNGAYIPAQQGYYSDGTNVYVVDAFGTIILVATCSGCSCGPTGLIPATVATSSNLCTVCCDTSYPLTIYHNGATGSVLTSATKAYSGASGGTLTGSNWYRESGSNSAVQIGSDGNTILQVATCTSCNCGELDVEYPDAVVTSAPGDLGVRDSCCDEWNVQLPSSTVYATDATYGVATGYFYDPYEESPVGETQPVLVTGVGNTGEYVSVDNGAPDAYGVCATGASKLSVCYRDQYVRSFFSPGGTASEVTLTYLLSGQDPETGTQTAQEVTGTITQSGSTDQDRSDALYSTPSYMTVEWEVPVIYGGTVRVRVWANEGDTDPVYDTGTGQPLTGTTSTFGPFGTSPTGGGLGTEWTVRVDWTAP